MFWSRRRQAWLYTKVHRAPVIRFLTYKQGSAKWRAGGVPVPVVISRATVLGQCAQAGAVRLTDAWLACTLELRHFAISLCYSRAQCANGRDNGDPSAVVATETDQHLCPFSLPRLMMTQHTAHCLHVASLPFGKFAIDLK